MYELFFLDRSIRLNYCMYNVDAVNCIPNLFFKHILIIIFMKYLVLVKRILIPFLFFILVLQVNAQPVSHKMGATQFNADGGGKILLTEGSKTYFVVTEKNGEMESGQRSLYCVDFNGESRSEKIQFPKGVNGTKVKDAQFISFNNKLVALVMGKNKKAGTRDVYAIEFDKVTLLAKPSITTVASEKVTKGFASFSYLISPNSKRLAINIMSKTATASIYQHVDANFGRGKKIEFDVNLFSGTTVDAGFAFALVRNMRIQNSSLKESNNQMNLTNEGKLVVVSYSNSLEVTIVENDGKSRKVLPIDKSTKLGYRFVQRLGNDLYIKSDIIDGTKNRIGMQLVKFNLETEKYEFSKNHQFDTNLKKLYNTKWNNPSKKEIQNKAMMSSGLGAFGISVSAVNSNRKYLTFGMTKSVSGRIYIFDQQFWESGLGEDLVTGIEGRLVSHTGDIQVTCLDNKGAFVYREKILKLGRSYAFGKLSFIPIVKDDELHVLIHDREENLTTWKSGSIKETGVKAKIILSDVVLDKDGKQSRVNTNIYDQKKRLFIRTDHSNFVNVDSALLMLFNRNRAEGKFVEVTVK